MSFLGVFCCSGCACGDVFLESVQGLSVGPACCRTLWGPCVHRVMVVAAAEPSIIPGAAGTALVINLPVPSAWLCWPPRVHSLCYPSPSQGHRACHSSPRLPSASVGIPWHRWGWHVSIDCSGHWLGHRPCCPLPLPAMLLFFCKSWSQCQKESWGLWLRGG